MIEYVNKEDAQEVNILELARAIKQACMRFPSYADCRKCECFNAYEIKCGIRYPSEWPIGRAE